MNDCNMLSQFVLWSICTLWLRQLLAQFCYNIFKICTIHSNVALSISDWQWSGLRGSCPVNGWYSRWKYSRRWWRIMWIPWYAESTRRRVIYNLLLLLILLNLINKLSQMISLDFHLMRPKCDLNTQITWVNFIETQVWLGHCVCIVHV